MKETIPTGAEKAPRESGGEDNAQTPVLLDQGQGNAEVHAAVRAAAHRTEDNSGGFGGANTEGETSANKPREPINISMGRRHGGHTEHSRGGRGAGDAHANVVCFWSTQGFCSDPGKDEAGEHVMAFLDDIYTEKKSQTEQNKQTAVGTK